MDRIKYPRTPHLPWSPGRTSDDKVLQNVKQFEGKQVVVTEKMDGECSTLCKDGCYARSPDSRDHVSRHWLKREWGRISHLIPEGWRICGENLFAVHSIRYDGLPSPFMVFSIWDEVGKAMPWDETTVFAEDFGFGCVPVLYQGLWAEDKVKACWTGQSRYSGLQEGYVVRVAGTIRHDDFGRYVAKYVRKGHVQTDDHWMDGPVVKNGIRQQMGAGL